MQEEEANMRIQCTVKGWWDRCEITIFDSQKPTELPKCDWEVGVLYPWQDILSLNTTHTAWAHISLTNAQRESMLSAAQRISCLLRTASSSKPKLTKHCPISSCRGWRRVMCKAAPQPLFSGIVLQPLSVRFTNVVAFIKIRADTKVRLAGWISAVNLHDSARVCICVARRMLAVVDS